MDELKIRTPIMRGIVGKLLSKFISKKIGRKINIQFTHIIVKNYENGIIFDVGATGEVSKEEFDKIIADLGL